MAAVSGQELSGAKVNPIMRCVKGVEAVKDVASTILGGSIMKTIEDKGKEYVIDKIQEFVVKKLIENLKLDEHITEKYCEIIKNSIKYIIDNKSDKSDPNLILNSILFFIKNANNLNDIRMIVDASKDGRLVFNHEDAIKSCVDEEAKKTPAPELKPVEVVGVKPKTTN